MYLKKDKRPNGRTHLAICKSYRDPNTKRIRAKSILNIGYLDEQLKLYDDPIAHFTELAKQMTEEELQVAFNGELTFDNKREEEILNFKKEKYFTVDLICDGIVLSTERIDSLDEATRLKEGIKNKITI